MMASQMIRVESLERPPQRAYCLLADLCKNSPEIELGEKNMIVVIASRTLVRRGYEPQTIFTAQVLELVRTPEGIIKASTSLAHFTLAETGCVDASLPEEFVCMDERPEYGSTSVYLNQFAPEISLPLVNWVLEMRARGVYIDPTRFSFPKPML